MIYKLQNKIDENLKKYEILIGVLLVNIQNNKSNLKNLYDHYVFITFSFNNAPINTLPNEIVFCTSFYTGIIYDGYSNT